ncbi:MAG TPA: hypothetical protein VHO70_12365 [Chitinispirillaceae bacterium]|nr:hypothetical protein [Chitinispirillaceae bacterium]
MSMTRDEIITLASRYIEADDAIDFPMKDDTFCILARDTTQDTLLKEEEGWAFSGYGVCLGYVPDEQAKPVGKWIFMHFASLSSFPPAQQVLRLQPPHIVKGRFQNPERTREIRILKLVLGSSDQNATIDNDTITEEPSIEKPNPEPADINKKIVKFRKKSS